MSENSIEATLRTVCPQANAMVNSGVCRLRQRAHTVHTFVGSSDRHFLAKAGTVLV